MTGTADGILFGDWSVDGSDPDPDGDGSPDERSPSCVSFDPVICTGEAFIVYEEEAELFRFDGSSPPTLIGELKIGDAGDVSPDGRTLYIHMDGEDLYMLDLTTVPALTAVTSVPVTGGFGAVHDWAAHPTNGLLYGGDSEDGQVAELDPASGERIDVSISGLPRGMSYGGAWFGASGVLFLHRDDDKIYGISLTDRKIVSIHTGSASNPIDGAACVPSLPPCPHGAALAIVPCRSASAGP